MKDSLLDNLFTKGRGFQSFQNCPFEGSAVGGAMRREGVQGQFNGKEGLLLIKLV